MGQFLAKADRLVAQVAGRQHGVVRTDQLYWAGLSPTQVKRRIQAGHLHRLYRGVYAVGHTNLSTKGRLIAAVFACGKGAVLSHESAAYLWSLAPRCPPFVHVTIPGTAGRARRKGIVLHWSTTLTSKDVTLRHNIPVTTPARTRSDLGWDRARTRSDLERSFLRVLAGHGVPKPEVGVPIGTYEVDFLWRAERLVVELDSYAYHSDRPTFTSDRARDRYLASRGLQVVRISDDELNESPDAVCSSLDALLQRRRRVVDHERLR